MASEHYVTRYSTTRTWTATTLVSCSLQRGGGESITEPLLVEMLCPLMWYGNARGRYGLWAILHHVQGLLP